MKHSEIGEVHLENSTFFHEGIVVDKYKIHFNDAAQISLGEFIGPILDELKKKKIGHQSDDISEVTDETVQATLHTLIMKKHKGKALRFLERFTKSRTEAALEKAEKQVKKVENRVKKDLPPIYQHISIQYTSNDGVLQLFPVELILRPDDTVKKILHSLGERAKIASSLKK